jgi:SAM-dependent methyltransferase
MDLSGGFEEYPFVAEFYDYVVPYRERPDVAFFVEMAREASGPVLELGCGTGRILIPTARAGMEIVGVDLSRRMLSICREKLSREPADLQSRVRLIEADMRQFDLRMPFRLVTLPFRSFQHLLTVDAQLSCLRSIHRHLVEGGRMVLDVFNPSLAHLVEERYLGEFGEEPAFLMPDGRRVVRRHRCLARDLSSQILTAEMIYTVFHPQGREERLVHRFQMRYLFRFEAEHLLSRAGFEVQQVYSDYDRSRFGSKSPGELIVVARKV